jgi:3-deoxy-manno-octulosonate cytidylyltransferase (CMP-KDO synthetase)
MFKIVIPARYGSTRLPGKPLLHIAGKPLLEYVWGVALRAGADETLIATDDERIASAAHAFGASIVMTEATHQSGTDRLAEVARTLGWAPDTVVVNLQGDEPLMPPAALTQVAKLLLKETAAAMATLSTPIGSAAEFSDPNVVKVVCDGRGRALYFSRSPIPFERDAHARVGVQSVPVALAQRHLGIYAYRVSTLQRLSELSPTPLELCERLEQLRALESGLQIVVNTACAVPGPGVDTAADLAAVERLLLRVVS